MNRSEAYEILTLVMQEEMENYLNSLRLETTETTRTGKDGDLYAISLQIEKRENKSLLLKGAIRGNNPQKFEILEEELEIGDPHI